MEMYLTYRLGVSAFERRDYVSAVKHFTMVLAEFPEHASSREYLARAHYHRAALKPAEEEARRILQADPTNEYVTLLLARILERQNRYDEAAGVRRQLAALSGIDEHLANHTVAA